VQSIGHCNYNNLCTVSSIVITILLCKDIPALPASQSNAPHTSSSNTKKQCPKLTNAERQLLYDNKGCLRCRLFFISHHSTNCPNDFPTAAGYKTCTQANVDKAKRSCNKPVTAVAAASTSFGFESESSMDNGIHPIAAVFGSSENLVAYMPANNSNVISNGTDSEDSKVSSPPPFPTPSLQPGENTVAPFHVPHMYWHCMATGLAVEFPIHIKVLFDHGSHAVPISEAFATRLGLCHHSLPRPETVELAMKMDKKKVQIQLHEWVKICLSDPASLWTSKSVRAIVAPDLCSLSYSAFLFSHITLL
jgi:hypothetical protein